MAPDAEGTESPRPEDIVTVGDGGEISSRVYARIGLLGNPSDGYGGRALALSLLNFYAEVTLTPAPPGVVAFERGPGGDAAEFAGLAAFLAHASAGGVREEPHGGARLLQAATAALAAHCAAVGAPLGGSSSPAGFRLRYRTTIPRQAGLSGSSALAAGAVHALLQHYGAWACAPLADRAAVALQAERDLGIEAGWMDRVAQAYGGLVHMDCGPAAAAPAAGGRPAVARLDPALLPRLWVIWEADGAPGEESGRVHADVARRWRAGDAAVRAGMAECAALADAGRAALERGRPGELAALMDRNFELRRAMFGDAALGRRALRMVEAARAAGAAAKFCGSGGAAVALCPGGAPQEAALAAACAAAGLACEAVRVAPPRGEAPGLLPE